MRVAIVVCSYNMPEYTDALVEHIRDTVSTPHDLIVIDNGSDKVEPSKHTKMYATNNTQMTPGFMAGLNYLNGYRLRDRSYFAYWLITTSCKFDPDDKRDPLAELLPTLLEDEKGYAIQPSLHHPDGGAWEKLLSPRKPPVPRRVWATDYVCTLYKAKYFDELGRWNTNLTRGWGVGSENFYLARKEGYHIYTHDGYTMTHDTAIGYKMNRMSETYQDRTREAKKELDAEFIPKYGKDYLEFLNWSHRETGKGEY